MMMTITILLLLPPLLLPPPLVLLVLLLYAPIASLFKRAQATCWSRAAAARRGIFRG